MRRLPNPKRTFLALAVGAALVASSCSGSPDIAETGGAADQLAATPANFDLAAGEPSRFLVGLFTGDKTNVGYGTVELSFTYLADGKQRRDGPRATASFLPIPGSATQAPPEGPALLDPDQGRGVYAATVTFDDAGFWEVTVDADVAGLGNRHTTANFQVLADHEVPAPGDPAPRTDNPTLDHPQGADPVAIDSRAGADGTLDDIPDPRLHTRSIRDAIEAHRPAVVVFSTPVFCVSRFCGPITDMVDELAASYADRAEFIHIEIWQDFENNILNPAAAEWLDPDGDHDGGEPWVFVIGADGTITHRFDNVATRQELEPILQQLPAT